jgi:hypothetical protein
VCVFGGLLCTCVHPTPPSLFIIVYGVCVCVCVCICECECVCVCVYVCMCCTCLYACSVREYMCRWLGTCHLIKFLAFSLPPPTHSHRSQYPLLPSLPIHVHVQPLPYVISCTHCVPNLHILSVMLGVLVMLCVRVWCLC